MKTGVKLLNIREDIGIDPTDPPKKNPSGNTENNSMHIRSTT